MYAGYVNSDQHEDVMNSAEVAALFGVATVTVARWRKEGRLSSAFVTLGGHHRYRRSEVMALAGDGAPVGG